MNKLWAMEVFVRVVESGSFSRAAESLELANATVTSSIRNLEQSLGVTLLQRNTRHLHLTEEGALYFERCKTLLQGVEQAEADTRSAAGEIAGRLRIEVPVALGHALICPAIPDFVARHPQLTLSVDLTNQPHNLIEHGLDVAIRTDHVEDRDLVAQPIFQARMVVCAAPALVGAPGPQHPRELDPRRCLGFHVDGRYAPREWKLRRGGEEVIVKPQGQLNYSCSEALVDAGCRGAGFIHVLDVFAQRSLAEGALARLFPEWETAVRTFYAVRPRSRYTSPKVRAFTGFLRELLHSPDAEDASQPVAIRRQRKAR